MSLRGSSTQHAYSVFRQQLYKSGLILFTYPHMSTPTPTHTHTHTGIHSTDVCLRTGSTGHSSSHIERGAHIVCGHFTMCTISILSQPQVSCQVDLSHEGSGTTPLMYACLQGSSEVVKLLLKREAQLSLSDKRGQSAIMPITIFVCH